MRSTRPLAGASASAVELFRKRACSILWKPTKSGLFSPSGKESGRQSMLQSVSSKEPASTSICSYSGRASTYAARAPSRSPAATRACSSFTLGAMASARPWKYIVAEINEAFAAQFLAVQKALGLDPAKTNVNGGAIALGHPLGASGSRIVANLTHHLQRNDLKLAVGGACIRGGQGIAVLLEKC